MLTREEAIRTLSEGNCKHDSVIKCVQCYRDIIALLKQQPEQSTVFTKEKALQSLNAIIICGEQDTVTVNKSFLKEIIEAATKQPEQPRRERKLVSLAALSNNDYDIMYAGFENGDIYLTRDDKTWKKLPPIPQDDEENHNAD